ncbi:ABC transporter ATP-binding protein [Variovorax ginsengisoli]|uniref:ABC transporter ATP-binding protein n=1 Tax=Variovorax ginsengisoli TaxID=363844 RepID=A0ABT8SC97_9BURK|nr:ABC transporter ATP-binding protein [Variovorax ginsengisoli]MDN8617361.1 ABC transporter ATP-binding protein [Variovorax ginsengisoli]MDO1536531.1 ABC transporter ATP-binding protein [Variovorax ginsengisoli]
MDIIDMLKVQSLHTYYGLSHILQGIDIDAVEGESIGIFGRNGAGKTTLLKTIAGWVRPSQGSLQWNGHALAEVAPDRVCRLGIGFIPEDRRIFPGLSVDENLHLGLMQARGISTADKKAAVDRMYKRFPKLAERRKQAGTTLSGGEQQMLAMARTIVARPRLLLIDEPTEGLAPMIVEDIFSLIGELKREGTTILLVEQNMAGALAATDRFYAIDRGRVILQGSSASNDDQQRLMEAIAV